jgi:hypothetical protein
MVILLKYYLYHSYNDTAPNLKHTCCEQDIYLDHAVYTDPHQNSLLPHSPSLLVVAVLIVVFPHEHPG